MDACPLCGNQPDILHSFWSDKKGLFLDFYSCEECNDSWEAISNEQSFEDPYQEVVRDNCSNISRS